MIRHVAANGLSVAYQVHGSGPPLVVLHGATSAGPDDAAAVLSRLASAFRVLLPDARGHGGTRWDVRQGFTYDMLVDDLAGFVDALGLATFHLLGFSMGAVTALSYAVRWPERLRTLVLVGVAPEREPRASVFRRLVDLDRIDRDDPDWGVRLARRHDPPGETGAWRRLLPALVAAVEAQEPPGLAELRRAAVPALVVIGDRDPFVRVDQAWALARRLPDAGLLVVPGCGHEVMAQAPDLFVEGCAGFYRATEPVAAARAAAGAARADRRPGILAASRGARPTDQAGEGWS